MADNLKSKPADAERAGSLHPPNQEVPDGGQQTADDPSGVGEHSDV
jgi:hypothetical protein